MENTHNIESEIKTWLLAILKKENIKDLSVNITGNSEKGDGYMGDIVFVHASASTEDNLVKDYDLVLKCSKTSQAFRKSSPVKEAFHNEMYIYNTILPYFKEFQMENGIRKPFTSVPKCYGTFVSENMEIIVLENLKKVGYNLWPKKYSVTRKHLNLVLGEYAKYHAISAALNDQRPGKIQEFADVLVDVMQMFLDTGDTISLFYKAIDEAAELLQEEMDESTIVKFKEFKKQIPYILYDLRKNVDGMKVILHGDSWNNNFMYKYTSDNEDIPTTLAILDWQLAQYTTPIFDLSYHIFTCITQEDLNDLSTILKDYYRIFSEQVNLLGSDPETLYPFKQFLKDWNEYSKFGIVLSCLMTKICSADKDEVTDLAQGAEDGKDFAETFMPKIKDADNFKRRIRPIIEYIGNNSM